MNYFTSAALGTIVADYDERNGTTIDTELELMSALATAGIRCSGGLPALQEYVLSCYAKDQQRQCDLVYGGRAVHMGDHHQQLNTDHEGIDSHHVTQANTPSPHSVHWQKLGASVLLQLKGAIASPPDQQRRNTALASPVSVAPGGVAAPSKSNKNRAKVYRRSASPPTRAAATAATATTSAAISPRVATQLGRAPGATAMPSSSVTAAYVTPRSLSLSQQNNNNNTTNHSMVSPIAGAAAALLSARRSHTGGGGGGTSILGSLSSGGRRSSLTLPTHYTTTAGEGDSQNHHKRNSHPHQQNQTQQVPAWMRLELPMGSATYVQLLMGLKAFLYSDVLEEALDGCRGGIDATGGSAVLVLERALQVVADRASSPDGDGRHTGGLPLDIIDDEVDATIGVGKPTVGTEDENGVDSSDIASPKRRKKRARDRKLSPTTRTTSPPGPAVPPAVLQQFMALAPNLRRQRLSEFRGAVAAYRKEIMNVLEHAATWGPNFGATVAKSFRLPSTFSGDGSLDATFDGSGAGSFGSFSVTAKGAATQQQQSATSDNFGGVVQRVMRGFQLDPSLILDEFRQHCAGSSNGNNENNMTDVFESSGIGLSRAANASLMTSSTTSPTLSPNHASPVSPRQLQQLQAHAVPTSAPAERSNSHVPFSTLSEQPTVDFSNWLLGRQERMIQELERVVGVGSSTDDVPGGEEPQYLGIAGAALVSLFGTPGGPTSGGSGGHRAVSPENAGLLAAQSVIPKGGHPTALLSHRRTLTTAPGGGGDSGGGGIVGGLSPILDTQSLEHTMSGVLDFQSFEGRTPRRGDERVSGLAPLDQIIERQKHRISQFRDVMPLELQFPYVANIVHKDHKRVTSSEEMLHDLCLSLPNTNVYRVAAALRERRDARLHPLDQGGDQDDGSDGSSSHHKAARRGRGQQHRNAFSAAPGSHKMDGLGASTSQRNDAPTSAMSRSVVGGGSAHRRRSTPSSRCASSQQQQQRVSVVLVTEENDLSMKKLILVPAGDEEAHESASGIPARPADFLSALPLVNDRLPDASEESLLPPATDNTTGNDRALPVSQTPSNSFREGDASQLIETNSSDNTPALLLANDVSTGSVVALAAEASSTSMISENSPVHQTEDEQLMCFWLQGGVPHPAPLSPAKLVQQRRKAAAAAAAPPDKTSFPSNGARKH